MFDLAAPTSPRSLWKTWILGAPTQTIWFRVSSGEPRNLCFTNSPCGCNRSLRMKVAGQEQLEWSWNSCDPAITTYIILTVKYKATTSQFHETTISSFSLIPWSLFLQAGWRALLQMTPAVFHTFPSGTEAGGIATCWSYNSHGWSQSSKKFDLLKA